MTVTPTTRTSAPVYRSPAAVLPTRLADGRELIYFDDTEGGARVLTDPRDLPVVEVGSTARYDALLGEWVGIASHRQTRTYHPPADQCPLCPTRGAFATEIPSPDYDVVVFENRFPSFGGIPTALDRDLLAPHGSDVLQLQIPGVGRCEVVCFTADHDAQVVDLDPARMRTVVQAWAHRTAALNRVPGVEQVFCFINQGIEIGVTLAHPHGQIYGYPFVTPRTAVMLANAADYRERTGGNLFGDLLDRELADGSRVVAGNDHWVAFVPFAARWPVEVSIYPRRRLVDLPAASDEEQASLAALYLEVLRRMGGVFDDTLPAITALHQAPAHTGRDDFWMHLSVFSIRRAVGKIKYLAGSESAMGAFVNDISPEDVAARLRAVEVTAR
ncbi:galactose-1-phosphate uridylyltransferase [Nakamurella deserti]|uniref:galactose-1-phosphate uridylyltransferase n=1 Tax=Nakamurella deserti TaxID=2164074 RepID=UPI000DBE15E1|nr:galactose-1-phosphate uridylyltransferase [Nakamurella deserti]